MNYDTKEKELTVYRLKIGGNGDFHFSEYWKQMGRYENVLSKWREDVKALIPKNFNFNDVDKETIVDILWDKVIRYFNPLENQNEWNYVNNAKNATKTSFVIQVCGDYQNRRKIASLSMEVPTGLKQISNKGRFNAWDYTYDEETGRKKLDLDKDIVEHINAVGLIHSNPDRNPETDDEILLQWQHLPKINSRSLVVQEKFGDFITYIGKKDEYNSGEFDKYNMAIIQAIRKFDLITGKKSRVTPGEFEDYQKDKILLGAGSPIEFGMLQRIKALTMPVL